MSPFVLITLVVLFAAVVLLILRAAHPLNALKVCTILAVLSGLAYNPESAFVPPGAFSEFFGKTDIVRALTVIVMLALLFSPNLPRIPYRHKAVVAVSAFPIFMAIVSVATGEPAFVKGVPGFALRMFDIVCFFSFGFWLAQRNRPDEFIRFMVLLALVVVGLNIAAITFDPSSSIRAQRFRGVSFSVNWAGMYLALLIVPVISALMSAKSWFRRSLAAPILVALLVLLLSTGSRGAIISCFAGVLTFLLATKVSKIASGLMAALLMLTVTFLPKNSALMSVSETASRFTSGQNTRETVWKAGWENWVDSGQVWIGTLDASSAVESQFLSILFVYGVIGAVVASLSLVLLFFQVFGAIRGRPSKTSGVAMSVIMVFLSSCFFEAPFFGIISAFNILLFISLGALFGDKASRQQRISLQT